MKEFLILLLGISCFGQEKMHLTAYRLIDEVTDGPCSVAAYVKINSEGLQFCVATADSDDQQLISNLLDIKKKARRGKSREFNCEDLIVNGDPIHQMFVISGAVTDTLFVDSSNQWIIFPEKHKAYFDKDQKFKNALTGIIKEFVEYDFRPAVRADYFPKERDSIPTGALLYKGRSGAIFIKNFEKDLQGYSFAGLDTVYRDMRKMYTQGKDTIAFYEDKPHIIISDPNTPWDINSIKPADPESKLVKQYPASTRVKMIYKMRFEDIKYLYFYRVALQNDAGYINYFIKDNVVESIDVYLY